jgi:hypothetical protein
MSNYTAANVLIGVGLLTVDGVSVGYTSGGVTITQKTDRIEKEVDQSYAPVGIHKVKESFELKTNLAEATLANLKIVWEQSVAIITSSPNRTLCWGMNPDVVEHTMVFKGKSPEGLDRTFTVLKAVVWESGEVNHQKNGVTVVPVTFRILPDTTKSAGKEYGTIIDTMA